MASKRLHSERMAEEDTDTTDTSLVYNPQTGKWVKPLSSTSSEQKDTSDM